MVVFRMRKACIQIAQGLYLESAGRVFRVHRRDTRVVPKGKTRVFREERPSTQSAGLGHSVPCYATSAAKLFHTLGL